MPNNKLLEGALTRLTAINPETDAEAFAGWGRDTEYARLLNSSPPHLGNAKQARDSFEKSDATHYNLAIRTLADDRLIGYCGIYMQPGPYRDAFFYIGIGERAFRGAGYGTDAHRAFLHCAFAELGLQRRCGSHVSVGTRNGQRSAAAHG